MNILQCSCLLTFFFAAQISLFHACEKYANTDIDGPNLDEINGKPESECCLLCGSNSSCAGYAWNDYLGGTCWLKSTTTLVAKTGVTAGILPVIRACKKHDNTDIEGPNLDEIHGKPESECCQLCRSNSRCVGYAWNYYLGGTCWLKSTAKLVDKAGVTAGVLSGCTLEANKDAAGTDIGNLPQTEKEQCCGECQKIDGCRGFAWSDYSGGTCWFKGGRMDTYNSPGVYAALFRSGRGECGTQPSWTHPEIPSLTVETICDSEIVTGAEIWLESVAKPGFWLSKDIRLEDYAQAESFFLNVWTWEPYPPEYYGKSTGGTQIQAQSTGRWIKAENGGGDIITTTASAPSDWESFEYQVQDMETVVFSRTYSNQPRKYVCISDDGISLDNRQTELTDNCKWKVQKQRTYLKENFRGTNLGGWLLLEKWMAPGLFDGTSAADEYHFMQFGQGEQRVKDHHANFLNLDSDYSWLKSKGINAVRIPVGHWIAKTAQKLQEQVYKPGDKPYINNGLAYLDSAADKAATHGLQVWIQLHGAYWSQNAMDHSGYIPDDHKEHWTDNWPAYMEDTVSVIEFLVNRYKDKAAFIGIGLLNEPNWDVSLERLGEYYRAGYNAVRKYSRKALVFMSDGFRAGQLLSNNFIPKFNSKGFYGVFVDAHEYQAFSPQDHTLSMREHVEKARKDWGIKFAKLSNYYMVTCGEWSLGLDQSAYNGMTPEEKHDWKKEFASAQIGAFDNGEGWFFWNYILARSGYDEWSFRKSVEQNVISLD